MTSDKIKQYYDSTKNRNVRSDLESALTLTKEPKIAIDCGCGAGSDIAYLLSKGFTVYGFDLENESISICNSRFKRNKKVILSQDSFNSFEYPRASLVLADASLFFCPEKDFENVFKNIHECLYPDGIFCGSFLGPEDTMAGPSYDKEAYWPDILVFYEEEIKSIFDGYYEIIRFTEHKSSGNSADCSPHQWHIFSVVAKKI